MSGGPLSDPRIQKRLKALELRTTSLEAADLDTVMRSTEGRRFMYRMVFLVGKLQARSYDNSGQAMAYNEGRRAMALLLLAEVQAICPELWLAMLKERIALEEKQQVDMEEATKPRGEEQ